MTPVVRYIDTNIFIYAFSNTAKRDLAWQAVFDRPFDTGVQTLNEFAHVGRRKLGLAYDEIEMIIVDICLQARAVHPLSLDLHFDGIGLAKKHQLSVYDAMHIACALKAGAVEFVSEDMQDGMVIAERLTIRNPFAVLT